MSLVGNLEDLPLTDILQIVSLSRKSGVLGLKRQSVDARVFFRNGLVVAARVSDFPLDLGTFLSRKSLLNAADLVQVRERVRGGEQLMAVLVNDYGVSEKIVEGFAKAGIEKVVYRLFTWKDGAFHFDLTEGNDLPGDEPFMPIYPPGINPQFLAMEGARLKDESDYFTTRAETKKTVPGGAPAGAAMPSDLDFAPRPPPHAKAEGPAAAPSAPAPGAGAARPLIVIVDNDAVALKNIEAALQGRGYEVASFTRVDNGIKAVRELLRKGRALVVLADLVMPKRDASGMLGGLEVLEVLRAEEQNVPIVMLADLQNPEAEKRSAELQCDTYLAKPGRKYFVKDEANQLPEFVAFIETLTGNIAKLTPKAQGISASPVADPFVDLRSEVHGELDAAVSRVSAGAPTVGTVHVESSRALNVLKEMVRELSDPQFNADVSLLVLRFAVEVMSRAVIFVIAGDEVVGLGQAGVERPDASQAVKKIRIPLGEPSIFADVMKLKASVRGTLGPGKWNKLLRETLGGEPTESFAAPVYTTKRIAAIVYGDNAADGKPLGDLDSFEIFLGHAGMAMERALLERKLRDLTAGQRINYSD